MISSKLLKIIFGILLVVIFIELTILFLNQKSKPKYDVLNNKKLSENKPRITKTAQLTETDAEKRDKEVARLLLENLKRSLDLSQKKILIKSQKIDVYESVIKTIKFTGGFKNTLKYDALIALEYKPDQAHTIYLTKNDLNKTKVFIKEKDKLLPYNFYLLKSGDRVKIELVTNVLEYFDKNADQITITKIK